MPNNSQPAQTEYLPFAPVAIFRLFPTEFKNRMSNEKEDCILTINLFHRPQKSHTILQH